MDSCCVVHNPHLLGAWTSHGRHHHFFVLDFHWPLEFSTHDRPCIAYHMMFRADSSSSTWNREHATFEASPLKRHIWTRLRIVSIETYTYDQCWANEETNLTHSINRLCSWVVLLINIKVNLVSSNIIMCHGPRGLFPLHDVEHFHNSEGCLASLHQHDFE